MLLLDAGTTTALAARDTSASDAFEKAYETLQSADSARDSDQVADAVKLYRQALGEYMDLSRRYPSWSSGVNKFRVAYCNNQLEALLKKGDVSPATAETNSVEAADAQSDDAGIERPQASSAAVDAQQKAANLEKIKSTAKSLLIGGDSDQARLILMGGLRAEPDSKSLRLMIGIAQCQAGMFTDAVYLLAQLVREEPSDPIAHLALGTACFGLGRMGDATKEINRALELNQNLPEAHYDMAQLMRQSSPPDMNGAKEQYQKSLDLGGKSDKELDLLLGGQGTDDGAGAAKTKKRQK
jgi:tetratricopeptide (TPR) repeat protein